jgi:hypothetical protein
MKFLTAGWVLSAGLVLAAAAANAQVQAPDESGRSSTTLVSDIGGPYAAMPPEMPGPRYGMGPTLMPPTEVYSVLRENGFLPLGIPRQRGLVYTISVLDRSGDDGRLVIDARTGRIIRFMPAYRTGDNYNGDPAYGAPAYGAPAGPLPPVSAVRGPPRPPAPIPRVASRTPSVPTPRPSPQGAAAEPKPLAANPAAASKPAAEPPAQQQSAVVQAKPAPQAAAPAAVEAKPAAPPILPTQEMPQAQGLD